MSIFQEAAIFAGDFITQPLKAKLLEIKTGKKYKITKVIEQGALMGDGKIRPDIKEEFDVALEALYTNKVVFVVSIHKKRVGWKIEEVK
jgi:hypothetical protein